MKNIILLVLLLGSIGAAYYFGYASWLHIAELNAKIAEVENIEAQIEDIQDTRDKLLERYRSVSQVDRERLEKLFPSNGDLEETYVFFQTLFGQSGATVEKMSIKPQRTTEGKGIVEFNIEALGSYASVRKLLGLMEDNIRLMEPKTMKISLKETGGFGFHYTGNMFYGD